jgi:hypothetical protein
VNFSFLLRLAATRMRSRACDASARPYVRDVLCGIAFPSVPALRSTCSAAGMPVLFAGFTATSAESDFSRPFIVSLARSLSRARVAWLERAATRVQDASRLCRRRRSSGLVGA